MFRTATVTELRSDLSSFLSSLKEGPLLVLSHSKPKAMMVEPELFENLLDRVEMLEDILDGRQAIAEYLDNPDVTLDAEEVFTRINQ
jgi:PHD/YefM family antitoxin component YafN of YafNO toxin-antitoxin module